MLSFPTQTGVLTKQFGYSNQGKKLVVFDKFVQAHSKAGLLRKVLNPLMTFLATDVTRDIYAIAGNNDVEFLYDDEAGFNGFFRHVLIQKSEE